MPSTADARRIALSLPEAVEQDHHGRPSFRVAGKIFATLWDEEHMNVMLDEPGIHTAVEAHPGICAEVWWGKRLAAVRVDLRAAGEDLLADLLADAWERRRRRGWRAVGARSPQPAADRIRDRRPGQPAPGHALAPKRYRGRPDAHSS